MARDPVEAPVGDHPETHEHERHDDARVQSDPSQARDHERAKGKKRAASDLVAVVLQPRPVRRQIGTELRQIASAVAAHDAPRAARLTRRHVKKFSELERAVQEERG